MKILFVTHSFGGGGAEHYLELLVEHCTDRGHRCFVVGPASSAAAPGFERSCALLFRERRSTAHVGHLGWRDRLANVAKTLADVHLLARRIRQLDPDVVYTNTSAALDGALAARLCGVPHVWHIHENFTTFDLRFVLPARFMPQVIAGLSDRIIFVTDLALRSVYPIGHAKAVVIHNGANVQASGAEADSGLRHESGDRRLAFFGALAHRKGLDVLIRALAIVNSGRPRAHLDVWGNGDAAYVRELQALSSSLGLDGAVRFMGYRREVRSSMPSYDAVVVPSRAESFSLVTLEAMASAVPVVVTRCGGPEEIVDDGVTGWIVPANDPVALCEAIRKVFDDQVRAREVALRARETAARDFRLREKLDAIVRHVEEMAVTSAARQRQSPE